MKEASMKSSQVQRNRTLKNIIYCAIVFACLLYYDTKGRVTEIFRKTLMKNAVKILLKIPIKTIIISNTKISTKITSHIRGCAISMQSYSFPLRKIQIQSNDVRRRHPINQSETRIELWFGV